MLIKGWNVAIIEPYILGVIVDIARIRTSSLSLPYFDEHQPFETLHIVTQRHILWRLSRPRNRLIHMFEGPINNTRYKIMLENGSFLKLCFMSWREGFPTGRREETSKCCWLQHARDKRASTKVQIFSFCCCAHSDFRASDLYETLEVEIFWSSSPGLWAINSFHALEQKYKRLNNLSTYQVLKESERTRSSTKINFIKVFSVWGGCLKNFLILF